LLKLRLPFLQVGYCTPLSPSSSKMQGMAGMGDPAAAVKAIADKLKENVAESGMDKADAFVDKLEELKEKAKNGPGEIMDKVKEIMEGFKKTLEDALNDPASLAPGGGLAACATWYGNAVVEKLKSLGSEFNDIFESFMKVIQDMAGPFKELGETMGSAMTGINKTVKGLSSLPTEMMGIADGCKGAADVKTIDTSKMKSSLDTSGMDGPLNDLGGLKEQMGPLATSVKGGVEKVTGFVSEAPDKIKGAFSVPTPLCFMTSCATPSVMKDLLDKVEAIKKFDFQPVIDMLEGMQENLGNMDTSKVSDPVGKFKDMAKEQIEKLDGVISAAKMAGGGMPGGFKAPF